MRDRRKRERDNERKKRRKRRSPERMIGEKGEAETGEIQAERE